MARKWTANPGSPTQRARVEDENGKIVITINTQSDIADAFLVAAAPDLLAVLEDALKAASTINYGLADGLDFIAATKAVRKAHGNEGF